MWAREESSFEVVEKAWQIPVNGAECIQLLKRCERVRNDFILWNKSVFGVVKARIRILEDKLKKKSGFGSHQGKFGVGSSFES